MGNRPPHIDTAELHHPLPGIRYAIGRRGEVGVQFVESLFGDGGQQLGLVGEMPVRRRGADPGAPGRLGEGEPFGPCSATNESAALVSARLRSPW